MKLISSVCIALALAVSAQTQAIFAGTGETAWAQYHLSLVEFLTQSNNALGNGYVVQPLAIAQPAGWDSDRDTYNLYLQQQIADQMPNWGPLYVPSAGRLVSDEYLAFLDRLNDEVVNGSELSQVDKQNLNRLNKERKDLQQQQRLLRSKLESDWNRYIRNTASSSLLTRSEWEKQTQAAVVGQIADLRAQLTLNLGASRRIINTAGENLQEVGRALLDMEAPNQRIPLPSSYELAGPEFGKDYWEYYYRGFVQGSLADLKSQQRILDLTLQEGRTATSNFSSSWNAGVSVSWFGIFGASGGASGEEQRQHLESETSRISIHFENIQPFPITRGHWYKGGLVQEYVDDLAPEFWGKEGRLNLVPTQLIVARGLRLDIEATQYVRDYFMSRTTWNAGGGVQIGPFRIGGSGGRTVSSENVVVTSTQSGISIQDNSGEPMIIAVISQRPADLLATPITPQFKSMSLTELLVLQEEIESYFDSLPVD